MEYHLGIVVGEDHPNRGVAFLISKDRRCTARSAFDCLDNTGERTLRRHFDMWQSNQPGRKRYHGFKGDYASCFVFKCGKNYQERFYGFLCRPKKQNPQYEICILAVHDKKKQDETNESDLRDVENLRLILAVREAITNYFKGK